MLLKIFLVFCENPPLEDYYEDSAHQIENTLKIKI